MDNVVVPKLYWLAYNAITHKNIIDKPNVPYDIRLFKKNIRTGLIGAIKKRDYNLINYHLWRHKQNPSRYIDGLRLFVAVVKLGDLNLIKYLINELNDITYFSIFTDKNNYQDASKFEVIINKVSSFITFEIFKYLYEITNIRDDRDIKLIFILSDRLDIIKYFINNSDPPIDDYFGYFLMSCFNGSPNIAKYIYSNYNIDLVLSQNSKNILLDYIRRKKSKGFQEVKTFLNTL